MGNKRIIVAVDGPAGSGKSSVSKEVARRLGLKYIDSGAVYRSITWYLLERYSIIERGRDYSSEIIKLDIYQIFNEDGNSSTFLNGKDVSNLIRNEAIAENIGIVSDDIGIRNFVNLLLREWAKEESIIMDGRDIGSVVFPDADVKIYLDASVDVRAHRRFLEYQEMGKKVDIKDIRNQIAIRDTQDKERPYGRLIRSEDSIYIDTDEINQEVATQRIIEQLPL